MTDDPLEIAIMAITDELESYDPADRAASEDYDAGYKEALTDTIDNLRMLQKSLAA